MKNMKLQDSKMLMFPVLITEMCVAVLSGCGPCSSDKICEADLVMTPQGRFSTVQSALEEVRRLRAAGRIASGKTAVVRVEPGRYFMHETASFDPMDSNVQFVGAGMEKTLFDGSLELPPFRVGRDGVWETTVPQGFVFEQLWVGDRRAVRARTPNRHYLYMKDQCIEFPNEAFYADPEDIAPIARLSRSDLDQVLISYWQSWDMGYTRLDSVDAATGLLKCRQRPSYPFFFWHKTCPRYRIENYRAALDAPGEWFLDVKTSTLHYIPLPGESIGSVRAYAPRIAVLFRFAGNRKKGEIVRDVTIQGVGFEHTAFAFGRNGVQNCQAAANITAAAIEGEGVECVCLRNCRVAHTAAHGLRVQGGSRDVTIEHCLFEDLGAGAVGFTGSCDDSEISERFTLRDSILRHGGRVFQGAIGVWIGHARNCLVEHNEISDFFYTGISCGWTWGYAPTINRCNRIAFNHVHHIGQGVLSDMGAIYTLGDNAGSVICNNWVSDVNGYRDNGSPSFGLYTDEGSHGFLFASNLVSHCRYCPLHQHFGKENAFVNNLCVDFSDCGVLRSRSEPHVTMALTNNVFWWRDSTAKPYVGWGSFDEMTKNLPVRGNVYWCSNGRVSGKGFQGKGWEDWRRAGQDVGGAIADPLFVAPKDEDWTLRPDSPALAAGFVPFDWREAGVMKDDERWRNLAKERTWEDFEDAPPAPVYWLKRFVFDVEAVPEGRARLNFTVPMMATTGRDGAFLCTTNDPYAGRHSLCLVDSPKESAIYAPHLYVDGMMSGRVVRVSFAFKPVAHDGMEFQVRSNDYAADTFKVGVGCAYDDGRLVAGGRHLCDLPLGKWALVEFELPLNGAERGRWSVSATPEGGKRVRLSFDRWVNAGFGIPDWFGFMTYGDGQGVWQLDEFRLSSEY